MPYQQILVPGVNIQDNCIWDANIQDGYRAYLRGCHQEAEQRYRTVLSLALQAQNPLHPSVAYALSLLGDLYVEQRQYAAAKELHRLAFRVFLNISGVEPCDATSVLKSVSAMITQQDRSRASLKAAQRATDPLSSALAWFENLFATLVAQ